MRGWLDLGPQTRGVGRLGVTRGRLRGVAGQQTRGVGQVWVFRYLLCLARLPFLLIAHLAFSTTVRMDGILSLKLATFLSFQIYQAIKQISALCSCILAHVLHYHATYLQAIHLQQTNSNMSSFHSLSQYFKPNILTPIAS